MDEDMSEKNCPKMFPTSKGSSITFPATFSTGRGLWYLSFLVNFLIIPQSWCSGVFMLNLCKSLSQDSFLACRIVLLAFAFASLYSSKCKLLWLRRNRFSARFLTRITSLHSLLHQGQLYFGFPFHKPCFLNVNMLFVVMLDVVERNFIQQHYL